MSVIGCSWKSNRRSFIVVAMRHRLSSVVQPPTGSTVSDRQIRPYVPNDYDNLTSISDFFKIFDNITIIIF